MKKRDRTVQIIDGKWYLDMFEYHECCDCGLVHSVDRKVERGKIFARWKVDRRATNKARRSRNIKVIRGR